MPNGQSSNCLVPLACEDGLLIYELSVEIGAYFQGKIIFKKKNSLKITFIQYLSEMYLLHKKAQPIFFQSRICAGRIGLDDVWSCLKKTFSGQFLRYGSFARIIFADNFRLAQGNGTLLGVKSLRR